jgi:hypothetical protein
MILRLLFGAMAEAWEMVKRPIHRKLIGRDYLPHLDPGGVVAYEALTKHFGRSNLLHLLRNTLVFHMPSSADLEAAFEDVPEDEDWAWYPSDTNGRAWLSANKK